MDYFNNDFWSSNKEFRVMTDQEDKPQYFDDRQEVDSFVYNQSLSRSGRWQLRSRTYGFESEYTRGILEGFRPTCATLGCLEAPTHQLYQWWYCQACHEKATTDETARRK